MSKQSAQDTFHNFGYTNWNDFITFLHSLGRIDSVSFISWLKT